MDGSENHIHNLERRHQRRLVNQRMEGEHSRQNLDEYQAPVRMQMYRPGTTYPRAPFTDEPYPVQEGVDLQQAHEVEADHMSMIDEAQHHNSAHDIDLASQRNAGQDTVRPPILQEPHLSGIGLQSASGIGLQSASGIGLQSASGFSDTGMNYHGNRNIQVLPGVANGPMDDAASQRNVGPLVWQDQYSTNGFTGTGQQSASGFSDFRMNVPTRNIQMLPSAGNESLDVDDVAYGRNRELLQKLKSVVKDYDEKKEKCIRSFIDEGFDRNEAEVNGTLLRYYTNVGNEIQCLHCRSRADRTDKFHHQEDCLVYKTMKEIGYASSDEDSLPQRSDSDVSMESEEDDQCRRQQPADSDPASGFQTLTSDDSLFQSGSAGHGMLPNDEKSATTLKQLEEMGYECSTILAVFDIEGPKCLSSLEDFLELEVRSPASIRSTAPRYTSVAECPPSTVPVAPTPGARGPGATWSPSGYATAGEFSQRETSFYSFSTSQGGGDVLQPPTFDYNFRGQTAEITGDGDVSLDYQYCLACKRERACVNQVPCGHVVCKRCGDPSNRICRVPTCRAVVKYRGCIDIRSMP